MVGWTPTTFWGAHSAARPPYLRRCERTAGDDGGGSDAAGFACGFLTCRGSAAALLAIATTAMSSGRDGGDRPATPAAQAHTLRLAAAAARARVEARTGDVVWIVGHPEAALPAAITLTTGDKQSPKTR